MGMSDSPSPLNLSELKIRILYGEQQEKLAALIELAEYGTRATSVMPTIVEQYRLGKLDLPPNIAVALYIGTHSPELLNALRAIGDWHDYNLFEKSDLLEAGVQELEHHVREYLGRNWRSSDRLERARAVEALATAGSAESLELLRVIEYEMAEQVRTESLRLSRVQDQDQIAVFSQKADAQFLEKVKSAIGKIAARR